MTEFLVLDAFGCSGGATAGYQRAGARVTAVDTDPTALAENPAEERVVGDAIAYVRAHGHKFTLAHGSPPCQRWAAHGFRPDWPDLIGAFRDACLEVGVPYVIENVHSARRELRDPVLLCGRMFGLEAMDTHPDAAGMRLLMDRHRMFETSWGLQQPPHPTHRATTGIGYAGWDDTDVRGREKEWREDFVRTSRSRILTGRAHVAGGYGGARRDPWEAKYVRKGGYIPPDLDVIRTMIGTPWISRERYLFEAIPPAYTEWIGREFLRLAA